MMTDRRLTRPIISLLVPIYDLLGILFPVIFTHMFILNYKTRHCGDICRLHKEAPCALELWMIFWPLGSQNKPGLTALRPFAKKAACRSPCGTGGPPDQNPRTRRTAADGARRARESSRRSGGGLGADGRGTRGGWSPTGAGRWRARRTRPG